VTVLAADGQVTETVTSVPLWVCVTVTLLVVVQVEVAVQVLVTDEVVVKTVVGRLIVVSMVTPPDSIVVGNVMVEGTWVLTDPVACMVVWFEFVRMIVDRTLDILVAGGLLVVG